MSENGEDVWLCARCDVRSRPSEWALVDLVTRACPYCGEVSFILPGDATGPREP